jgi:hypothetical protein
MSSFFLSNSLFPRLQEKARVGGIRAGGWSAGRGYGTADKLCSCLALAALVISQFALAPDKEKTPARELQDGVAQHLWHGPFIKVFRGPHVPKKLSRITIVDPFTWVQTEERIGVVATGTKVAEYMGGALTFEWEGLYADHWGTQDFHEMGAAMYGRWNRFPWNNYLRTTFAVGAGLTMTDRPAHYEPRGGIKSRWLFQLNFEINIYSPLDPQWALLFRIQHRSGIYTLINNVRGGSNFLTIGLRRNF